MTNRAPKLILAGETHAGLHRRHNEDCFLTAHFPDGQGALAVVSDGIGGHARGEVASGICCRMMCNAVMRAASTPEDPTAFLMEEILKINELIFKRNYSERRRNPMGCTAVMALFTRDKIAIANAGDSRCYEYLSDREPPLRLLTTDHRPDEKMLDILAKRYRTSKASLRNRVLLNSLGIRHDAVPDIHTLPNTPGAIYLLCSDGLSGSAPEENIAAIMGQKEISLRQMTSALVREALLGGGKDNVTVITAGYRD